MRRENVARSAGACMPSISRKSLPHALALMNGIPPAAFIGPAPSLAGALPQNRHSLEGRRLAQLLQHVIVLFAGCIYREVNPEAELAGCDLHRFRHVVLFFKH